MTVRQLPSEIQAFARYLVELTARLDPRQGWYAVFLRRDPQGMRACLHGSELPPWDVVDSLLQDLGPGHGAQSAHAEELHAAAAAVHDLLPGGRETLEQRLGSMRRERLRAQGRVEEVLRLLPGHAAGSGEEEHLLRELAWARDDHTRAVRCVGELQSRLAVLGSADGADPVEGPPAAVSHPGRAAQSVPHGHERENPPGAGHRHRGAGTTSGAARSVPADEPPVRKKPRRRGGARFAGVEDLAGDAVAVPLLPAGGNAPRGARYTGAVEPAAAEPPPAPDGAERAARETAATLGRLRAQGRGGEAHAVICAAAARPAAWLPALADALNSSGLAADWATVLWEAASQPARRLAQAAGALDAAGRGDDGRQLLRQGVFRSADEIADAVLALLDAGARYPARTLLGAFVQARTAEDTAAVAGRDPGRLVPLLLDAARAASTAHERDIVHALRVAGHLRG